MGNGSDCLIVSEARRHPAINDLEYASFGAGSSIGDLIQKASHVAIALRRVVAIVDACCLVAARADTDPRGKALCRGESCCGWASIAVNKTLYTGDVVAFDLNAVSINLGPVPFDEILGYRAQDLDAHKRYALLVRKFAMELARMPKEERTIAFELRQTDLMT